MLPQKSRQIVRPVLRQKHQDETADDHDCSCQFHAFELDTVQVHVQHCRRKGVSTGWARALNLSETSHLLKWGWLAADQDG